MTIQKSFYSGTIQSNASAADVGGLVSGVNGSGNSISDSYTSGTIAAGGNGYKGGLVSHVYSNITISNSYTSASITFSGTGYGGGLIAGFFAGSVTNSFSAAAISGSTSILNALYGTGSGTNTGNYFDTYLAGTGTSGCSGGCTAVNASNATPSYFKNNTTNAPLSSWDFTNTWQTSSGAYPTLQGFSSPAPIPTQTPAPQAVVASSNSGSSGTIPSCGKASPSNAPALFKISTNGTSATLYFVPVSGQNTGYTISYGQTGNADNFATTFAYNDRSGLIPYTINNLYTGTWYFKVRGQNECMPGHWSGVMSTKISASRLSSVISRATSPVLGASTSSSCSDYVVQSGDSLWEIASAHLGSGTKYQTIMQQNNLPSTLIHTGQKLKIGC